MLLLFAISFVCCFSEMLCESVICHTASITSWKSWCLLFIFTFLVRLLGLCSLRYSQQYSCPYWVPVMLWDLFIFVTYWRTINCHQVLSEEYVVLYPLNNLTVFTRETYKPSIILFGTIHCGSFCIKFLVLF